MKMPLCDSGEHENVVAVNRSVLVVEMIDSHVHTRTRAHTHARTHACTHTHTYTHYVLSIYSNILLL